MTESRFIELLNLYVDHQLSTAEAAELEGEIARNEDRRSTYQQYCRMQKACTLLFEQERNHAPASKKLAAALREADRKIVAFPAEQVRPRRGYYPVGLLAAAACAAFIFTRFTPSIAQKSPSTAAPTAVAQTTAPAPQPAVEVAQAVSVPAKAALPSADSQPSFYSVFAPQNTAPGRTTSDTSNRSSEDVAAVPVSYTWMRDVELAPVQSLPLSRITLKNSSVASSEDRVIRSRKPVKADKEETDLTAYQFQR